MLKRTVPALALVATAVLSGCGSDDTAKEPRTTPSSSESRGSTDASASAGSSTPAAPDGPACVYTPDGSDPGAELPPATATRTADVDATLSLATPDPVDLAVTLHAGTAPCTVNSFAHLAGSGYFDKTACHRLTTEGIFVLQCGDPTGTGMGTPGYSFDDELAGSETYPAGTLAMANAGPNTNGSQFFIVYAATQLPPSYTVFGTVDPAGVAAVSAIAKKGTDSGQSDGAPKETVEITSVKIG